MTQPTSAAHQNTSRLGRGRNAAVVELTRQVAAGGVQDALRLGGRARGVEDVQRVLGIHRLGGANVGGLAMISS